MYLAIKTIILFPKTPMSCGCDVLLSYLSYLLTKKLLIKEKQLEATHIYNSMLHATHHILNNLLNQMQLFKMEAVDSKDFKQDMISTFDTAIDQASDLIDRLSSLENITGQDIWASVDPNLKGPPYNKTNAADS